jgi:sulfite exporter TauE/SafE/copper chaperone CopZ
MEKVFRINGMHCNSCAQRIEDSLKEFVNNISINYSDGEAEVDFDEKKISEAELVERIKSLGYEVRDDLKKKNPKKFYFPIIFLSLFSLLVLYVMLKKFGIDLSFPSFDFNLLKGNPSLFLLFFAGLLTGFHCIAMCGGFLVSYTTKNALTGHKSFLQHFVYGFSKTISYTIMGAFFGLIGSIFVFSSALRGSIAIFAGFFMILYAFSMFGMNFFKQFQLNPKFLTKIATKKYSGAYFGPIMTGLLNGLFIACGPLQALYLYAAGTGSAIQGGLSLMVFGLGTLPVMFGFGGITNIVSHNATRKILKISAIIVLVLGLIMLNRGLSLVGNGYDIRSISEKVKGVGTTISGISLDNEGYQVIYMNVTSRGWEPDKFVLKKNVPVKWVIDGKEITSCNNAIQVPDFNLRFDIKRGVQIIEFTPNKEGVISWSCWMGMIPGTFIVTDDGLITGEQIKEVDSSISPKKSCGGSCGGCGGSRGALN